MHSWEADLSRQYQHIRESGLQLDLTRGKPCPEQLKLSEPLDGILEGNYVDSSGADLRNYGGLDGILEARALFAEMMGVRSEEILVGGNSSLTLMYFAALFAHNNGLAGPGSAWRHEGAVKFLAPVPGYDRHFSVCEHLGIELVPVPMTDEGPDMDRVEELIRGDGRIKGIWCVPRFSNPSGIVYSDDVVRRMARLGNIAGANFRIFWDNAYAVHALCDDAPALANLMDYCREEGTEDSVYLFGSTSKITFAGAGVGFVAMSPQNLAVFRKHLGMTQIGPDKLNQLRHVRFLKDMDSLMALMRKHAAILKPRFDAVLKALDEHLAGTGMGEWTEPKGGYFISFNTLPGLAQEVVKLAGDAGVKLTPAGATFPYGRDPDNRNIRLAPSFPTVAEIERAMEVFVTCVKLASVRQKLAS